MVGRAARLRSSADDSAPARPVSSDAIGAGDAVVSRNLYASYAHGVVKGRPLIFETHQLEHGVR